MLPQFGLQGGSRHLDRIKALGFHYATTSGITIAINDIQVSPKKEKIIEEANRQVEEYQEQYMQGLVTEEERYSRTVATWTQSSDQMEDIVKEDLSKYGGVALMAVSGAKGNISQIKQMAGMRGLMSDPKGRIIELPIKSSFREASRRWSTSYRPTELEGFGRYSPEDCRQRLSYTEAHRRFPGGHYSTRGLRKHGWYMAKGQTR